MSAPAEFSFTATPDTGPRPEAIPAHASAARIVIAGAGPAACNLVSRLAASRFPGSVTLLSARDDSPEELLDLAALPFVSLRFGQPASHIDAAARVVSTADGMEFSYDQLVIATGSAPGHSPVEGDLVVLAEEQIAGDNLAASAGLETAPGGGIVVGPDYRSSVPGIWAIGDAATLDGVRLGLLGTSGAAAGACAVGLMATVPAARTAAAA